MLSPMATRYFRAGIGTVIFNDQHQLAFFERAKYPEGVWQFQQGGIDKDEIPSEALWRELMEEVGLSENDVELVFQVPHWISYEDLYASADATIQRLGQTHRWFFLRLKPEVSIDLARATDDEFRDWRFVTFAEAIAMTHPHKQPVYQTLYEYFKTEVLNR
jgi:putative (di)nucleoside polyphosphate hydrolase